MNFEQAEVRLRELAALSEPKQRDNLPEINEVFELFWRSNPTKQKFASACSGLIFTPSMMWVMAKVN